MRYWTWTADDTHLQGARHDPQSAAEVVGRRHERRRYRNWCSRRMPVPARRERWQKQAVGGHSAEEMETALAHVRFIAAQMETELAARGPWLAGETFSLGDISMGSIVHRVNELYPELLPRVNYPHDQRLVRTRDGAAGGDRDLHARHRGDAETSAGAIGRRDQGLPRRWPG